MTPETRWKEFCDRVLVDNPDLRDNPLVKAIFMSGVSSGVYLCLKGLTAKDVHNQLSDYFDTLINASHEDT